MGLRARILPGLPAESVGAILRWTWRSSVQDPHAESWMRSGAPAEKIRPAPTSCCATLIQFHETRGRRPEVTRLAIHGCLRGFFSASRTGTRVAGRADDCRRAASAASPPGIAPSTVPGSPTTPRTRTDAGPTGSEPPLGCGHRARLLHASFCRCGHCSWSRPAHDRWSKTGVHFERRPLFRG